MGPRIALGSVEVCMWFCGAQCAYWHIWAWHPPVGVWIGILGLLGVLVPLIRDPKDIGKREKALWTIILFLLLGLEFKSVYQDRDEHDAQQAEARDREIKSIATIADGINGSIQQSQEHFDATMRGFDKQSKSFSRLEREREFLAKQMSEVPLSSMSPEELGAKAGAVAQQMHDYLHSYQIQDKELYLQLYDRLYGDFGATTPPAELKKYIKDADKQRADFTDKYKQGAKKLIAQADLLRAELVSRLQPPFSKADDDVMAKWFQDVGSDKAGPSFLFKLDEAAAYLNGLAGRVQSQEMHD
jgi:hypothetical protein